MRIEVEQISERHWLWSLWLAGTPVIQADRTYGSQEGAEAAAALFCREVGCAPVRGANP